jgi:hypothetical protein
MQVVAAFERRRRPDAAQRAFVKDARQCRASFPCPLEHPMHYMARVTLT